MGKSERDKHELLFAKGQNWAKYPAEFKRGRGVLPGERVDLEVPIFNKDRAYLDALIPEPS